MPQADPEQRTRAEQFDAYRREYDQAGTWQDDLRMYHVAEQHPDGPVYHHYHWLDLRTPLQEKAVTFRQYFVGECSTALNTPQEVAPMAFDPRDAYYPNQWGPCTHVPWVYDPRLCDT